MLLDKLESGFLLLQTRQGLLAVEPSSFWQRAYLVWTFRNFRQLSVPLLNTRQAALINNLFREHAEAVSHRYDRWLVIGVVENFVPPPIEIDSTLAARIDASLAMKARLAEEARVAAAAVAQIAAAVVEAAPDARIDTSPVEKADDAEEEHAANESARPASERFFAPAASWAGSIASGVVAFVRAAAGAVKSKVEASKVGVRDAVSKMQSSRMAATRETLIRRSTKTLNHGGHGGSRRDNGLNPSFPRVIVSKVGTRRVAMPKMATAAGAVGLCICFVVAWHRIGAVPGSQAHGSPVQASAASTTSPPEPLPVAESSSPVPGATDERVSDQRIPDQRIAGPEAAVEPTAVRQAASVAAIPPAPRTRVHEAVSAAKAPLAIQDSAIEATRPPLRFVYPVYSGDNARGAVALTAGVDSKGNVRTVKIVSGNRGLAVAAVQAVRQWRYRPYMKNGQPVASETNIVITFFSSEAISMSYPPKIAASR